MPDLPPTRLLTPEELLADESGELLYLYDQAIAAGEVDDLSRISWVRLGASDQWASALECLELMSRVWPRPRNRRPADDITGKCMGRFVLQKELGRGGTSIVFLAIDPVLKRRVALKVPRPATLATPDLRRRFLQEGRAAAALKHRNIVAVLEAAENEAACYLVSEYCRGPSLAEWLKERTRLLPPRVAASWMADLAEAVQHAHEQGVLHRDIKPSNVLLEPVGAAQPPGEFDFLVKLSDFGLAKLLSDRGETRSGAILGTPAYMSPEQAAGQVKLITEISDVYSLGAVLYELLSGRPPFQAESDLDLLQQVVHDEPLAPRKLHAAVPRDLETICLKCLAKEPARRYASARDLAEDLGRFLDNRPIRAKRVTVLGRGVRWVRRNPALALAGGVAVALLLLAGVGLTWHFQTIAELDRKMVASEERSEEQKAAAKQAEDLAQAQENAGGLRTVQSFVEQRQFAKAVLLLETLRKRSTDPPGFAWRYWWNVCHEREMFPLVGTKGQVRGIAISPDDALIAGCTDHGQIALWNADSAAPFHELEAFAEPGSRVVFSPGGKYLGAISQGGSVRVWDTQTRQVVCVWNPLARIERVMEPDLSFTDDDRKVAIATEAHTVTLVEIASGGIEESPPLREPTKYVRFLPGSQRMVTAGYDGVRIWSPDGSTAEVHLPEEPFVSALAVSRDGSQLAYGRHTTNEVVVYDVSTGQPVVQLPHASGVYSLGFSGDGRRLLVATADRAVVWDLRDRVRIRMNSERMHAGDLSQHGRLAALADAYGQAWLFRLDKPPRKPPEPQHADEAWAVAYHPHGKWIATGSDDNTLVLWERETGRKVWTFDSKVSGYGGTISQVVFTPNGKELVAASLDHTLSVVALAGEQRLWLKGHAGPVRCVAVSPDGRWIVSGDHLGVVRVWDLRDGSRKQELTAHAPRKVRTIVFARDGKSVLTGGEDNWVCHWNAKNWELKRKWKDLDQVWALAIHPRQRIVAQGNALGMITIRDLDTGQVQRTLQGHADGIRSLAYCPEGRTLASGSEDRHLRLWDVETSQEVTVLKRHHQDLHDIAYAPDGRQLASTSHDGRVHLWDAGRLDGVFLPHSQADDGAEAVPDQAGELRFPWVQSIEAVSGEEGDDAVDFQVTFSEEVTGVDAADFRVSRDGVLDAEASLSVVRDTGTVYTVHVGGLGSTRRLRVDLADDRSIHDLAGNPLTAREVQPSFTAAGTLVTGPGPTDVSVADLNGDGLADLLVPNSAAHCISLWMGREDRLFPTEMLLGAIRAPLKVVAGELNGDNSTDIVTINGDSTVGVYLGVPGPVAGVSEGSFLGPQLFPVGPAPEGLELSDFNRDSRLDVLVATPGAASASLLLGLGNGDFAPEQRVPLPAGPRAVATGDLDNDGHLDIAALLSDGCAATCLGNGNGAFRSSVSCDIGTGPLTLAMADFTGDRIVDLVTASGATQQCLVHVGDEKGTFEKPWSAACGPEPQDLVMADLNSDGSADIVLLDAGEGTVSIFFSGGRKLRQRHTVPVGERPTAIAAGDFNGDHRTDLAVLCAGSRTVTVWLNDFRGDFEGDRYRNTR